MSTREEMLAITRLPTGLSDIASGDGPVVSENHQTDAVTTKARKGARRAILQTKSVKHVPDADTSTGLYGPDIHEVAASEGDGRAWRDIQIDYAIPHDIAGHLANDGHDGFAGSGIDHKHRVTPLPPVDPATIAAIQSLHREHRAIQRAKGDMERRIKADERWFAVRRYRAEGIPLPDGKFPDVTKADQSMVIATRQRFFTIRDQIEAQRKQCQKELLALVKPLPVMGWVAGVKGLGLPSVAAIIGEAGDLANYSNPGKLWKRMGLAVFDGKAQGKRSDAAEALRHGYNPARRSEMHVVGDCLVRAGGPYADLYRARKAVEMEREGVTKMHAHKRALRYIEKRLLREMWQAWRGTQSLLDAKVRVSPADFSTSIVTVETMSADVVTALDGHSSVENQLRDAIQDGGQPCSGDQITNAPVPHIPRKRAPRTQRVVPSLAGMSGATV
jgi:hypothetical protein